MKKMWKNGQEMQQLTVSNNFGGDDWL